MSQATERNGDPWWAWGIAIAIVSSIQGAIWWAAFRTSRGPPPPGRTQPGTTRPRPEDAADDPLDVDAQLEDGIGYVVRNPDRAWATSRTAEELDRALRSYAYAGGETVQVNDVSREGGGSLAPHKSHDQGVDADIVLPEKLEDLGTLLKMLGASPWLEVIYLDTSLQQKLHDQGDDEELRELLQYPDAAHSKAPAAVRHWDGHKNHIHVRYHE